MMVATYNVKTLEPGKLEIILLADQLSDEIWKEVIQWRFFERDTIGRQLVRAVDSVSANLSEASGRYNYADRKRFAYFARGSLYETVNWLEKSSRRKLIDDEIVKKMLVEIQLLSRRLNAYIKALKASQ